MIRDLDTPRKVLEAAWAVAAQAICVRSCGNHFDGKHAAWCPARDAIDAIRSLAARIPSEPVAVETRSERNKYAEVFIRGIEAGAEQPDLAGDGDAMYQRFREWAEGTAFSPAVPYVERAAREKK